MDVIKRDGIDPKEVLETIERGEKYLAIMKTRENHTPEEINKYKETLVKTRILKKRLINHDILYFLENYMYIENKSGAVGEDRSILFKLFPEQKRVLKEIEDNKKNIILKARQLGITWLALGYGIFKSLQIEEYTVGILSQTEDYMQEAINRIVYVFERLPFWLIKPYNSENLQLYTVYLYEKKNDEITIYFPQNKEGKRSTAKIKGFISTEKAGRSITADLLIFDEWAYHENAEAVFGAAYPIINRPDSGKFIGLSSNKRGSFFESIVRDCLDENKMRFNLIFLSVFADPRRTVEWYEETKGTLKNSWMQEYPETVEQALSAGELTAFPEFSPAIHVCEPFDIPNHWTKWFSVDNGYNDPFAWYKAAINEDGTIFIYYEYTRDRNKDDKVHYSDQAKNFMESCIIDTTQDEIDRFNNMNTGYDVPLDFSSFEMENLKYGVFGLDAFNKHHRDQTGKSLIDYYKDGGMNYNVKKAVTDRKLRKDTLHEYLKPYYDDITGKWTAKVQIFNTCTHLIKYIPQLVVEDNNPTVVADNSKIDNCLTGDTLVNTVNGLVPIKDLIGTNGKVVCFDEENARQTTGYYYNVRMTSTSEQIYEIVLEDGRSIKATSYHPIYTQDGWKTVEQLTKKDKILDIYRGYIKIKSIKELDRQPVYNMEVKDYHNFAVNGGLIVHNCYDSFGYLLISSPKTSSQPLEETEDDVVRYKKTLIKRLFSGINKKGVIN